MMMMFLDFLSLLCLQNLLNCIQCIVIKTIFLNQKSPQICDLRISSEDFIFLQIH